MPFMKSGMIKDLLPTSTSRERVYTSFLVTGLGLFVLTLSYTIFSYVHQKRIESVGFDLFPVTALRIQNPQTKVVKEIDENLLPKYVASKYLIPDKEYEFQDEYGEAYLVKAAEFQKAIDAGWVFQDYATKRQSHYYKNLKYELLGLSIVVSIGLLVFTAGLVIGRKWLKWINKT